MTLRFRTVDGLKRKLELLERPGGPATGYRDYYDAAATRELVWAAFRLGVLTTTDGGRGNPAKPTDSTTDKDTNDA